MVDAWSCPFGRVELLNGSDVELAGAGWRTANRWNATDGTHFARFGHAPNGKRIALEVVIPNDGVNLDVRIYERVRVNHADGVMRIAAGEPIERQTCVPHQAQVMISGL